MRDLHKEKLDKLSRMVNNGIITILEKAMQEIIDVIVYRMVVEWMNEWHFKIDEVDYKIILNSFGSTKQFLRNGIAIEWSDLSIMELESIYFESENLELN
jgi:hypothetical protein